MASSNHTNPYLQPDDGQRQRQPRRRSSAPANQQRTSVPSRAHQQQRPQRSHSAAPARSRQHGRYAQAPSMPSERRQPNPYAAANSGYGRRQPKKRRSIAPVIIVVVLVLVAAGVGVYLITHPPVFDVTINGQTQRVSSSTTIQSCIDDGYASPTAGNLLAVDGSVITQGGGNAFAATINGEQTTDPNHKLVANAVVEITNGADTTESCTEKTEAIPFSTSNSDTSQGAYYAGAIHRYSEGQDGEQVTRTGDVSGITVTEVTKQPVDAGYLIYDANVGDDKAIALTFDDGPWPTTEELLDVLKENDVHATFFTIGEQISQYPNAIQREVAEGHQIASHSWDHASGSGQGVNLTYMSAEEQIAEVDKSFEAIDEAIGTKASRILRAPGGNFYGDIVDNLAGRLTAEIGWNVDTMDWSRPGVDHIVSMLESVQPGQVILCHDGGGDRSQTIEALKVALPVLKEQGFKFVTIDELLAYPPAGSSDSGSSESTKTTEA